MNKLIRTFAFIPGTLVVLLPIGKCPACWPAYLGFLSAIGLGFLVRGKYLFPTVATLLLLVLLLLAWKAASRWGYGPLLLGITGSIILLVGKFRLDSNPILYTGISFVVIASIWNSWPRKRVAGSVSTSGNNQPACPHCATEQTKIEENENE